MKLITQTCLIIAVALFVGLSVAPRAVLAQGAGHDHAAQAAKPGGMQMDGMKMDRSMMEQMAAKKKANTERINTLMATVRSTTGDAKAAAMADVVSVLLEERAAMQEHCAAMMAMMKK